MLPKNGDGREGDGGMGRWGDGEIVSHSRAEVPSVERSGATRRGGLGEWETRRQGEGLLIVNSLLTTPNS